jgi:hypothetical protein
MGYPSSIVTWDEVATVGRVLRAQDAIEVAAEMEALQSEVGIEPHGSAGSIAERLSCSIDAQGNLVGRVAIADADDNQRKRMRLGYREFVTTVTGQSEELVAAFTFDRPLKSVPLIFLRVRRLSTAVGVPVMATWGSSVATTHFNVLVQPQNGSSLVVGIPFGLTYLAIESEFDVTDTDF